MNAGFSSRAYWEARYEAGGNSGVGSQGWLGLFKAAFLNRFITANAVRSVADFGCGDGAQLALLEVPRYVGIDVSPTALARCAARVKGRPETAFVPFEAVDDTLCVELGLSLDVIYHLVEDSRFELYMRRLFASATRFVVVYSSNAEASWPASHVRHRGFSEHVKRHFPAWRLVAHVPNPYGFDPADPIGTSFADFYVFAAPGEPCTIVVPP